MRVVGAALLVFVVGVVFPGAGAAEETQEQWLVELRNSGTYKKGLDRAVDVIEHAFDIGAVGGASQWRTIHEYYREAATSKGCKAGAKFVGTSPYDCPKLTGKQPGVLSPDYAADRARALEPAENAARPDLVRRVLTSVYQYGYAHGLEYGWRKNDGDVAWTGRYYKACMEYAAESNIEKQCAKAADTWAGSEIERLKRLARQKRLPIPEGAAGQKSK